METLSAESGLGPRWEGLGERTSFSLAPGVRGQAHMVAFPLHCSSIKYTGGLGFFFFLFKFTIIFNFLAMLCNMWDLNSPTRDGTHAPCIGSIKS